MATSKRIQPAGAGSVSSRHTGEQSFHVPTQSNSKLRAAMATIPQLTDNPLYEGGGSDEAGARCGPYSSNSQVKSEVNLEQWRVPASSRPALDKPSQLSKPSSRRHQSWSLSSGDYEGILRAAQEDVLKSSRKDSMSALDLFKQFRQKLADLKQVREDASSPTSLPPSGSIRSLNLEPIAAARSWNFSSRPTSPLKKLSVLASRKGVNGLLHPQQRDISHHQAGVAPSMQRFAVNLRAEGLFRIPNPASISPAPPPASAPLPADATIAITSISIPSTTSRQRSPSRGGSMEYISLGDKGPAASNDAEDHIHGPPCSPKNPRPMKPWRSGVNNPSTGNANAGRTISCAPMRTARNGPQQQHHLQPTNKKTGKMSQLCSPRKKNTKTRCIHIPRPLCYSAHILD